MALLSQVSTSYPRVPRDSFCPDTGVFSYLLSGYGQFILPASFLPLHGYWSLHFDLCPSHFHTCSGILFRIIPALFLSFRIYCIFCLKGKSGLSLLISFPSRQAYNPAYSGTSRIHYPVHFSQNAGTGSILTVTDFRRQFSAGSLCFFMVIHFTFGSRIRLPSTRIFPLTTFVV